jgi:hypothetical protein
LVPLQSDRGAVWLQEGAYCHDRPRLMDTLKF